MKRPFKTPLFALLLLQAQNFNPRNTQCIHVVKIIDFLELEQKFAFCKGLMNDAFDLISRVRL